MSDAAAIEAVVRELFTAFASDAAAHGSLDRLPSLFAPEAQVLVLAGDSLVAYGVADFIRPRRELLLGGTLREFSEWETAGETLLGRDIACRRSRYAKRGVRDGVPFSGSGTKVFSFVRRGGAWQILSLLWQDDA